MRRVDDTQSGKDSVIGVPPRRIASREKAEGGGPQGKHRDPPKLNDRRPRQGAGLPGSSFRPS